MVVEYDIQCFERTLKIQFPDGYESIRDEIIQMLDEYYTEWTNFEDIEDEETRDYVQFSCCEEYMMERLSETYSTWTEWHSDEYTIDEVFADYLSTLKGEGSMSQKYEITGSCSKFVQGRGWVTEVTEEQLNAIGFARKSEDTWTPMVIDTGYILIDYERDEYKTGNNGMYKSQKSAQRYFDTTKAPNTERCKIAKVNVVVAEDV